MKLPVCLSAVSRCVHFKIDRRGQCVNKTIPEQSVHRIASKMFKDNIIFYFLFLVRALADFLAVVYAMLLWPDKKNKLPPIRDELLLKPVTELVDEIKSGKVGFWSYQKLVA